MDHFFSKPRTAGAKPRLNLPARQGTQRRLRRHRVRGLLPRSVFQPLITILSFMTMITLLFCFVPVRLLDEEDTVRGRILRISSIVDAEYVSALRNRRRGGVVGSIMKLNEQGSDEQHFRGAESSSGARRWEKGLPRQGETIETESNVDDRGAPNNNHPLAFETLSADSEVEATAQDGEVVDSQVFGRAAHRLRDEPSSRRKTHDVYLRLRRASPEVIPI